MPEEGFVHKNKAGVLQIQMPNMQDKRMGTERAGATLHPLAHRSVLGHHRDF